MGNNLVGPEDPVRSKTTERGSSYAQRIRYAASGMKGLRATMEDKHLSSSSIEILGVDEPLKDHSLFAVFDGHGGDFTAEYSAEHFMGVLSRQPQMSKYASLAKDGSESRSDVTGIQLLREALEAAFHDLDEQLRPVQQQMNNDLFNEMNGGDGQDDEIKMFEHSGSTCIVVMLTPSHIIGCNAGDSRAVLRRCGKVLPLSFDHKPSEIAEKERITEAGGYVKARRVDGDLAVSRALGDFMYKANETLPADKQKVIPSPDMVVYPRSVEDDEFIVLACDGVWDVASNKQCSDFVQQLLFEGETDLGVVCEEALDTCLERNSKDNMTIMIVGLPGMRTASGAVTLQNAVWGRRAARQTKMLNTQAQLVAQQLGLSFGVKQSDDTKAHKPVDVRTSPQTADTSNMMAFANMLSPQAVHG